MQAEPSRALTASLDDHPDQRLVAVALASAAATLVVAADKGLVDLDLPPKRLSLGGHHRPAQLLEDQPGGLVARDPELTLELDGGNPRRVGGDEVGGPEPEPKRGVDPMHDRPRGDRRLMMTPRALPQVTTLENPASPAGASGTAKALRPTRRRQVVQARSVVGKALLKIHDAAREVWPAHTTTIPTTPDATG